jgi:hypothetical protein
MVADQVGVEFDVGRMPMIAKRRATQGLAITRRLTIVRLTSIPERSFKKESRSLHSAKCLKNQSDPID